MVVAVAVVVASLPVVAVVVVVAAVVMVAVVVLVASLDLEVDLEVDLESRRRATQPIRWRGRPRSLVVAAATTQPGVGCRGAVQPPSTRAP